MVLEVQICTYGIDGLARVSVMRLPAVPDVLYTVCLQNPSKEKYIIPEALMREDVRILEHESVGLSNNRNFGINNSVGDIILIADDDLNYEAEGLKAVIETFERHPELDFATFRHTGGDKKIFPEKEFDFSRKEPKGYYLTSFELALRKNSIPEQIRFSVHLGIGAANFGASEEGVFLLRLIRSGLTGAFFPIDIVEHVGKTTGSRKPSCLFLRALGAYFWIRYGWVEGLARLVKNSFRYNHSYLKNLLNLLNGFVRAHYYFHKDGSDR